MHHHWAILLLATTLAGGGGAAAAEADFRSLGQRPPGATAELFAPEIMRHQVHGAPSFSADGTRIYWSTVCQDEGPRRLLTLRYREGAWEGPLPVPFAAADAPEDQPCLSADGRRLVFASLRAGSDTGPELWSVTRRGEDWSPPVPVGLPPTAPTGQWTPSLTRDGTLCFSARLEGMVGGFGIYLAQPDGDGFAAPTALPECINRPGAQNWTPWIAPDGSFLLFASGREPSAGSHDLFISYRDGDNWSEPVNLGPAVNTEQQERFPGLSPDGRYLFFTRDCGEPCYHDLYWVAAGGVLPHLLERGGTEAPSGR